MKEMCEGNEFGYIELRNDIIELWAKDITQYLSLESVFETKGYSDEFQTVITKIWTFLNQFGFINFGICQTNPNLSHTIANTPNRKKVIIIGAGLFCPHDGMV